MEAVPELNKASFTCPHCSSNAPQSKFVVLKNSSLTNNPSSEKLNKDLHVFVLKEMDGIDEIGNKLKTNDSISTTTLLNRHYRHIDVITQCYSCKDLAYWRYDSKAKQFWLCFPKTGVDIAPEKNMPEDVKKLYIEASDCYPYSKRAAAALIRAALDLYLQEYMQIKAKNLNERIANVIQHERLPAFVCKGLDIIRVRGNEGAHL